MCKDNQIPGAPSKSDGASVIKLADKTSTSWSGYLLRFLTHSDSCQLFALEPGRYAMVETFFKTLKAELVWRTIFQNRIEAAIAIGRYIDGFYNPVRRHSALEFISPLQFEGRAA